MVQKLALVQHRHQAKSHYFVLSFVTSACLFAISVLIYSTHTEHSPKPQPGNLLESRETTMTKTTAVSIEEIKGIANIDLYALLKVENISDLAPPQPLTVILPIISTSLHRTQELIEPFLQPLEYVRVLVIVCPDAISSDVRHMLQKKFASLESADHPDVSLRPWQGYLETSTATLRAAMDCATDRVLILDETSLMDVSAPMLSALLHPPPVTLPFGPKGIVIESILSSAIFLGGQARPASYLLPPFVTPSSFVYEHREDMIDNDTWSNLGRHIAFNRPDELGGIIVTFDSKAPPIKLLKGGHPIPSIDSIFVHNLGETTNIGRSQAATILPVAAHFVFFLPTREDLRHLMPLICKMKSEHKDDHIRVLVYTESTDIPGEVDWETEYFETYRCDVKYEVLTGSTRLNFGTNASSLLSRWLGILHADVVFAVDEPDNLVALLDSKQNILLHDATVIKIPRCDLGSTEWMSSLRLEEWKNWHQPRIDVSIITKDRPQSLLRLLDSLANAKYFGDHLDVRVNVEQDCDLETLKIVENMIWPFGRVVIHRRIVHGGLLTAVVESWYPTNNHSYGLLLEDDIELSPLYYAWIKMTLLRYRYNDPSNTAPRMFGISLYQQKHLELLPEGRQPFNPRSLFEKEGQPHPTIPYLSQIPCSWGAIYFPEHWREFHDYLAVRLAETVLMIEDIVVPNVRSNHWSKSWKKFFIELVYLRGYVMLYPNYDGFLSLSTNHLEVGSHVKLRSAAKQELFLLPLMRLQRPGESSRLLDLPGHTLPGLNAMPVLNLTGSLVSLENLAEQGMWRRNDIMGCDSPTELYDVRALLCIDMV